MDEIDPLSKELDKAINEYCLANVKERREREKNLILFGTAWSNFEIWCMHEGFDSTHPVVRLLYGS